MRYGVYVPCFASTCFKVLTYETSMILLYAGTFSSLGFHKFLDGIVCCC